MMLLRKLFFLHTYKSINKLLIVENFQIPNTHHERAINSKQETVATIFLIFLFFYDFFSIGTTLKAFEF